MDFHRYVADLEGARFRAAHRPGPDNVVVLATTASTNSLARSIAHDLEAEGLDVTPMLILALAQTGGRGRQGRSWVSPAGRGVYGTLVHSYKTADPLPTLPLLAGVGLCRALAPYLPAAAGDPAGSGGAAAAGGCRLKWPNDLVVPAAPGAPGAAGASGRKIGGILIEALIHSGAGAVALIGFGVNHSHDADQLPPGATSLQLENPAGAGDLAQLTWDLVAGLERELRHAGDAAYAAAAYSELSIHRPGDRLVCQVGDRRLAGTFAGFDAAGRLRLRHPRPAEGQASAASDGGGEAAAPDDQDELLLSAGEVIEHGPS